MDVILCRVGRVFLQPDKNDKRTGKYNRVFSEGWVEFTSKKVAKFVAENLNCKPVGGKRKSKAYDELWNIKYLPRSGLINIVLFEENKFPNFQFQMDPPE